MLTKKIFWGGLVFLGGIILLLGGGVFYYLHLFSRGIKKSDKEVWRSIYQGAAHPHQNKYLSFLVLGLDERKNNSSLLTDTIIVVVLNKETGNYLLFSLPRDLWLDDLKTKINALYFYGQKRNPQDGTFLVKEKVEEILKWPIDYTVVLKMDQVKKLIDLLGGVWVEVEHSFTDEEYPLDDGTGRVTTISFEKGRHLFDGEKALQFMRSRKSRNPLEGNDDARQKRQKKVVLAIRNKLFEDKSWLINPHKVATLFLFFTEEIRSFPPLTLERLVSFWPFAKVLGGEEKEGEISWRGKEALLVPGRDSLYGLWILLPKENNWQKISEYFHQQLP